eukprot:207239_1
MVKVRVRNGSVAEEQVPTYISLIYKAMYNRAGSYLSSTRVAKSMLQKSSNRFGCRMADPKSKRYVEQFVQNFHIDMDDFDRSASDYESFNDFFMRRLKPGARQITGAGDARVAVSPADCRLMVFPSVKECQRLWIKSKQFSIDQLLTSNCPETVRRRMDGCSVALSRLAPHDYHHWHLPVDATFVSAHEVAGALYSVSRSAVTSSLNVLGENKRTVFVFDSKSCGTVVMVAVGAALVGCIECVGEPGDEFMKGDEHGFFKFGGSTVLTLFQKGAIEFDSDLISNSSQPIETLIKMGDRIGTLRCPPPSSIGEVAGAENDCTASQKSAKTSVSSVSRISVSVRRSTCVAGAQCRKHTICSHI